eukprot:26744-Amphidinium_carterae.1
MELHLHRPGADWPKSLAAHCVPSIGTCLWSTGGLSYQGHNEFTFTCTHPSQANGTSNPLLGGCVSRNKYGPQKERLGRPAQTALPKWGWVGPRAANYPRKKVRGTPTAGPLQGGAGLR